MADVVVATRGSRLALAQARRVAERLAGLGLEVDLLPVTTTGDLDRTTDVASLTEVGAFVRAVQREVLEGRADLAVHSCKDLPVEGPDGLVAAYPEREAPWDVLCGAGLDELLPGQRVGTGSPRRAAQLALLRPEVEVVGIRGNVDTRLGQVGNGCDAVVLAEAGLRRLGWDGRISHRFSPAEMVPAPAQGALALEAREGSRGAEAAATIDDAPTRAAVEAERLLLEMTGAGCRSALGAIAWIEAGRIRMEGFVADGRGPRRAAVEEDDPKAAASALREALGL